MRARFVYTAAALTAALGVEQHVLDSPVAVPLPAAVWGGLGLVSALAAIRAQMALRRATAD